MPAPNIGKCPVCKGPKGKCKHTNALYGNSWKKKNKEWKAEYQSIVEKTVKNWQDEILNSWFKNAKLEPTKLNPPIDQQVVDSVMTVDWGKSNSNAHYIALYNSGAEAVLQQKLADEIKEAEDKKILAELTNSFAELTEKYAETETFKAQKIEKQYLEASLKDLDNESYLIKIPVKPKNLTEQQKAEVEQLKKLISQQELNVYPAPTLQESGSVYNSYYEKYGELPIETKQKTMVSQGGGYLPAGTILSPEDAAIVQAAIEKALKIPGKFSINGTYKPPPLSDHQDKIDPVEGIEVVELTLSGLTPEEANKLLKQYSKNKQVMVSKSTKKEMATRKPAIAAWPFESSSMTVNGDPILYTTRLNQDGTLSCNCPGWTMGSAKGPTRFCKHTKAITEESQLVYKNWKAGKPIGDGFEVVSLEVADASAKELAGKLKVKTAPKEGDPSMFMAKRIIEL